jgi:hypothetical protein
VIQERKDAAKEKQICRQYKGGNIRDPTRRCVPYNVGERSGSDRSEEGYGQGESNP